MSKFKTAVIEAIRSTRKQGRQSLSEHDSNCMLRGCNGDRCTIGFMIKDEYYDKSLEDFTLNEGSLLHAVTQSIGVTHITTPDQEILIQLQNAHDHPFEGFDFVDFVAAYEKKITNLVNDKDLPEWTLEGLKNH